MVGFAEYVHKIKNNDKSEVKSEYNDKNKDITDV